MSAGEVSLLAQLAQVHDQTDEAHVVQAVVAQARTVVPDAEHVSLTVRRRTKFLTLASTSPTAAEADRLQYALREGPCVSTATDAGWLRSGDIRADNRWPEWGFRAAELGLASIMSVSMMARGERVGALNMYSSELGKFNDSEGIELAELYAHHVAYALSSARLVTGLETAISSRHVIGIAQGIIMQRYGVDMARAFAILQRVSSAQNRKLKDLAAELATTRQIDDFMADVAVRAQGTAPDQSD